MGSLQGQQLPSHSVSVRAGPETAGPASAWLLRGPFTHTHTHTRAQPFQLRDFNAGALFVLPSVGHMQLCLLSLTQQALSLSVCRKLDGLLWARPRHPQLGGLREVPLVPGLQRRPVLQRVAGRWAALAEVRRCRPAGGSLALRFASWLPAPEPPPHAAARHSGPSGRQTLAFPGGLRAFLHGTWTASFDIN